MSTQYRILSYQEPKRVITIVYISILAKVHVEKGKPACSSASGYAPNQRVSVSFLGTRRGLHLPTTHHFHTWFFVSQPPYFVIDEEALQENMQVLVIKVGCWAVMQWCVW